MAGDIENAYLTAACQEKMWMQLGKEFVEDAPIKIFIII
jgi:hypothetical protein